MSFVERCRQRHIGSEGGDEGFTLIELLVVLLIIGILLAIAIPTFLSVTKGANNTAAESNLQTALTGAKTYYTQSNQTFVNLGWTGAANTNSPIQAIDTGLSYVTPVGQSAGPHNISFIVGGAGSYVILTALANGTNDCWGLLDVTATQTAAPMASIPASTGIGTYFFVKRNLAGGNGCTAGTVTADASSTTGFPKG